MSVESQINGVDINALADLRERLAAAPEQGDSLWRADVRWKGGFVNEVRVRDLTPLLADEPRPLGGTDTAPNPVEQLLGSLGTCLAIGYAANASAQGIAINDLRIELEGHIDLPVFLGLKDGNAGYPQVTVRVHLDADAPPQELERLHERVVATSPVGNTLQSPVTINAELHGPGDR